MMKKVFVCCDSFGVPDPEFNIKNWAEQLTDKLSGVATLTNLSRICASNLHIALQVDRAIASGADYIIYITTSSIRDEVKLRDQRQHKLLLDRLVDITTPTNDKDLTSYSIKSLDNTTLFDSHQLNVLKQFHLEFFDLDLAIYRNELFIEASLSKLVASKIPFKFDQGGFEHPGFIKTTLPKYFKKYQQYRTDFNMWDFVLDQKLFLRPYYHILEVETHEKIADYYYQEITKTLT
jgi:hypothetical protein